MCGTGVMQKRMHGFVCSIPQPSNLQGGMDIFNSMCFGLFGLCRLVSFLHVHMTSSSTGKPHRGCCNDLMAPVFLKGATPWTFIPHIINIREAKIWHFSSLPIVSLSLSLSLSLVELIISLRRLNPRQTYVQLNQYFEFCV